MMQRMLLIMLMLIAGPMCSAVPELTSAVTPPEPGLVRYELSWRLGERATRSDSGTLRFQTDLGYTVELLSGYLISSSIQQVECPAETAATRAPFWMALLGGCVARAGHGAELNPVAVEGEVVEDLLALEERVVGTRELTGQRYCSAHYLSAALRPWSDIAGDNLDRIETTLSLTFRWSVNGGEATEVTAVTQQAYGLLGDLYDTAEAWDRKAGATEFSSAGRGATVVVERDISPLFDGIHFQALEPDKLAFVALGNVVKNARLLTTTTLAAPTPIP